MVTSTGEKKLTCIDCRQCFLFDLDRQEEFLRNDWPDPVRCPSCVRRHRAALERQGEEECNWFNARRVNQRMRP
jgi:hypothetical protein